MLICAGRAVIAAFGESARFIALQEHLTDEFLVCNWATLAGNRFLGLAVDAISYVVVAGAAFFSVFGRDNGTPLGPAAASLALIYAMQVRSRQFWEIEGLLYNYTQF